MEHVACSSKVISGPEIPARRLYVSHSSRKNAHWDSDDSMIIWEHLGFLIEDLCWCMASGAMGAHVWRRDSSVRLQLLWLLHRRLHTRSCQLGTWWQAWFYILCGLDMVLRPGHSRCMTWHSVSSFAYVTSKVGISHESMRRHIHMTLCRAGNIVSWK